MKTFIHPILKLAVCVASLAALIVQCRAELIFSDDFTSGTSASWGNEAGAWSATAGVYAATAPNNFPNAFSSLPFELTDFSVDVDINSVGDGGVWLRSTPAPGTAVGIKGVLLVLKNADFANGQIYWHIVSDPNNYGEVINQTFGAFPAGSSLHVRVEVSGDTYAAFLNGSNQPSTTLTTSAFASGRIALYDFSRQTFDNVRVERPGPAAANIPTVEVPYIQVRWQSVFGTWYQVQAASAPAKGKWTDVGSPLPGTGAELSKLVEATREQKFYRVEALQ